MSLLLGSSNSLEHEALGRFTAFLQESVVFFFSLAVLKIVQERLSFHLNSSKVIKRLVLGDYSVKLLNRLLEFIKS